MNDQQFRFFTLSISWTWLTVFALVPTLMVIITSFLETNTTQNITAHFTLENYAELVDVAYLKIFLRSLLIAGSCTLLCLIVSYPFAYGISHSSLRYRSILLLLVIIPFWTSSLIRTYAIMTILKTKGIINTILLSLGIIHQPLQLLYTNIALFIGLTYTLLPFMLLPLYANMEKMDLTLIDAARDLGASKLTVLRKILIPITMPGILAGSMMVFLPAMTLFYIPNLLGGAKSMLLGNLIQEQFLSANNWPLGAASSVLLIIFMLILAHWYWQRNPDSDRTELL